MRVRCSLARWMSETLTAGREGGRHRFLAFRQTSGEGKRRVGPRRRSTMTGNGRFGCELLVQSLDDEVFEREPFSIPGFCPGTMNRGLTLVPKTLTPALSRGEGEEEDHLETVARRPGGISP